MTLTLSNGPLAAGALSTVNYAIDGPQHKILFSPFPRRVRAVFAGETFVDTDAVVAWSSNLQTSLNRTMKAKAALGLGSGEAVQLTFQGDGIVIVQPSEGHPIVAG